MMQKMKFLGYSLYQIYAAAKIEKKMSINEAFLLRNKIIAEGKNFETRTARK
jgi:hypothetical protein